MIQKKRRIGKEAMIFMFDTILMCKIKDVIRTDYFLTENKNKN